MQARRERLLTTSILTTTALTILGLVGVAGGDQSADPWKVLQGVRQSLVDAGVRLYLWENPSLVFRDEYEATSGVNATDPAAFFGHETNALDRLSEAFARAIVSAILEAF